MENRDDYIKNVGSESDVNVRPGKKLVANSDNLRYASQLAKKVADSMDEFSPDKIAASLPDDIKFDTESSAYREWKEMMDDISQRLAGRFHNISFDRLFGSSVVVKDNSVESDLTLPSEELSVEDLVNSSDISLDNVDNKMDSISEMDEMFLDGDSNLDAIDKSFSKSR